MMLPEDRYGKRACFDRALALLAKKDDDVLAYAALELRQTIEAIVYEKLQGYSKYVPGAVIEKWQPAHAMKMLVQFEPGADENVQVRMAPETTSGVAGEKWTDVGEHRTFAVSWLDKNYNKLGNYLHVPHGRSEGFDLGSVRADLERIAAEIAEVLKSTITLMALAERVQFKCAVCGQEGLANADGVRRTGRVTCVSPNCGAVYFAKEEDGGWTLAPDATDFKCRKCDTSIRIQSRLIHVGLHFRCPDCQTEHVVVEMRWRYGLRQEVIANE